MTRPSRERLKTYKNVFDTHAERCLFKLAGQGHFDSLDAPLSIGKEANIFIATKGREHRIVKIYRLETCDFNRMFDYLRYDPRYPHLKSNRRRTIFMWAKREFRNLLRARDAGVRVPTPYAHIDNILIMECIGGPAQRLKDDPPKAPKEMTIFLSLLLAEMTKLHKNGLVHGDLSEYNILNYQGRPVLIDLSHTIPLESIRGPELLARDIKNVSAFFSKHGIKISENDIVKKITKN